jgi:phospholipid/cholesterol/gamma-HCH transport system ATP-binding protein
MSVRPTTVESTADIDGPAIFARELRVHYGDREILHGISFDVRRQETIVILGGSGSGKSTLLRTMVGLEKPTSGSVWVHGTNLANASIAELADVRKKIGLSFQGGALIGSMTVGENVALPLQEHTDLDPSTIEVMVRIKLQQVGLIKFQHFMPSQLSGGMKKRAALARAMAMDPEILFFDEPTAGLDPIVAAGIDNLILNLKKALAVTIVVVTHELASAFMIADRIMVLDGGHIVAIDSIEALRANTHPRIQQLLNRVPDSEARDDVDHLQLFTE